LASSYSTHPVALPRRRSPRRVLVPAVGLLIGLAALAAPPVQAQRVPSASAAADARTLVIASDISDARSFDPGRSYELSGSAPLGATYDSLVYHQGTDTAHLRGRLATSWDVSKDGATFTFHLRKDVTFWNGDPLTAADVVFSYQRLFNLKDNPQGLIAGLKSISAVDPYTVKLVSATPDVSLLAAITGPNFGIIDSKAARAQGATDAADAAKADKATTYLNNHSLGSGPFILSEWTPNQQIVLTRNVHYWGPKPSFDKVIFKMTKEAATQKLLVQKGDADVALQLGFDQIRSLRGSSGVTIDKSSTLDYVYLPMTTNPAVSKPLSNPMVRQALRYAIDYDGLIAGVLDGAAIRPATIIPLNLIGSDEASNAPVRPTLNVAKAKSLLASAGYPNGFSVKLTYSAGYVFDGANFDLIAQVVQHDLANVGVKVTLNPEPPALALKDYRAQKTEMGVWYWGADYPDPQDNMVYFGPGGPVAKRVFYLSQPALTALIKQANQTGDARARGALYNRIIREMATNSPYIVVAQPQKELAHRSILKNFYYSPDIGVDFRTATK